jgi:hypothetical protein
MFDLALFCTSTAFKGIAVRWPGKCISTVGFSVRLVHGPLGGNTVRKSYILENFFSEHGSKPPKFVSSTGGALTSPLYYILYYTLYILYYDNLKMMSKISNMYFTHYFCRSVFLAGATFLAKMCILSIFL